MSEAIVQSIETLLITAFNRLTTELQAETDKKRVDHLLVLALRARIPKALAPATPCAGRRSRPEPEENHAEHRSASTSTRPGRAPNPTDTPAPTASTSASPLLAAAGCAFGSEQRTKACTVPSGAERMEAGSQVAPAGISTLDSATRSVSPTSDSPLLAAAGPGGSRLGDRLHDAPDAPTAPEAHAPAAALSLSRAELLAMPIEELFKDDIAAFAAEIAELRAAKAPGPYVFATEYTVRENFHSHPRNADGTLQPLVEIPPGVIRPTPLERILMITASANFECRQFFRRRDFEDAKAAREASESRQRRKPRSTAG